MEQEIKGISVRFEHNGQMHEAIFNYVKPRACGIIERRGEPDQWWTLLNATPEEVIEELHVKYGMTLEGLSLSKVS